MEDGMKERKNIWRWKEGKEDFIEDRMKGGKIIWKMKWRNRRLYRRWNEGEDYIGK